MNIAIILTCYNRKKKTLRCLSDLYDQILMESTNFDIFLVDDGSTDGTSKAVSEEFPKVNIIKGDGTLFWNRGMHLAWKTAAHQNRYDGYLWVNDDTFLFRDSLCRLIETCNYHDNQSIVIGPCCWETDKTRLSYGGYINHKRLKDANREYKCETMNGNIVFIPKSVYEKIGNLDYTFHHACGDFDYGRRARKAGIDIIQVKGFCGICDRHEKVDKCFDINLPLLERIHMLNFNHRFEDAFELDRRSRGLLHAIFNTCTVFIHLLLPSVYNKIYGNKNI